MTNELAPYSTQAQRDISHFHSENSPGDAQKSITRWTHAVKVSYNIKGWMINLHRGEGDTLLVDQGQYRPPFVVKAFVLYRATGDTVETTARIVHSVPWADQIDFTYATGIEHPGQITRLYLAGVTGPNFSSILLLG